MRICLQPLFYILSDFCFLPNINMNFQTGKKEYNDIAKL